MYRAQRVGIVDKSGYSARDMGLSRRPQLRSLRVLPLRRGGGGAVIVPVEPRKGAVSSPAATVPCIFALRNSAALFKRGVNVGGGGGGAAVVLLVVVVPFETEVGRLFLGPAEALEAGRDADTDDESEPPVADAGLLCRSRRAAAAPVVAPGAFANDDEDSNEGRPAEPFVPAPPPVRRLAAFVIRGAIAGSRSAFKSAETTKPTPVLGRPDMDEPRLARPALVACARLTEEEGGALASRP